MLAILTNSATAALKAKANLGHTRAADRRRPDRAISTFRPGSTNSSAVPSRWFQQKTKVYPGPPQSVRTRGAKYQSCREEGRAETVARRCSLMVTFPNTGGTGLNRNFRNPRHVLPPF
ncbi:hypothetical protein BaRGS_00015734 [Batillaria attramentaria]|uniref:Uncharacterized protein n=1 Tax=Batillaria attramentaria TaxID=370345 RepID=A0ABD0L0H4_9CAEN